MAWDTEATRRRLLDAGTRQFAARGYSGARMDAIGRDAGVNKERIYPSFRNKPAFYLAVLTDHRASLPEGAHTRGGAPAALGDFAGALLARSPAAPPPPRLPAR